MKFKVHLTLSLTSAFLLTLSGQAWAERITSYWNSSTGAQVKLVLDTDASDDKCWEITVSPPGGTGKSYFGRRLLGASGFEYDTSVGSFRARQVGPNELRLTGDSLSYSLRWTRRGSRDPFTIPDVRTCKKTKWKNGSGGEIILLTGDKDVSITIKDDRGLTSYRSRWVAKPTIFEYGAKGGRMHTATLLSKNRLQLYENSLFTLVDPNQTATNPETQNTTRTPSSSNSQNAPQSPVEIPTKDIDFSEIGDF